MSFNVTTNKARSVLGKHSNHMTDEAIEKLLGQFYELAEIVASTISECGSKNLAKGLEIATKEDHNEAR